MSEHECIIGLLNNNDMITLKGLKGCIEETKIFNQYLWNEYPGMARHLLHKEYTLKDYADRRKSTNLTRFEFCPYCGKKIDWKKIKEENKYD